MTKTVRSGWSVTWPKIYLTFQGSGWYLDGAVLTLTEAKRLRNNLDGAISQFEKTYPDLPKVGQGLE